MHCALTTAMNANLPGNFRWLNLSQALGSFMDNLFKMLTVFYLSGGLGMPLEKTLALATVLLVVPFILFSNLAGSLVDRYSKTTLFRIVKGAELALLSLSFPAYYSGRAWPMLGVLVLLATQSAFFGPLKRGIIPEVVPARAVADANGRLSSASYLGIIAGMVLPSFLLVTVGMSYPGVLAFAACVSVVGLAASFGIPPTAAKNRPLRVSPRIVTDTFRVFRELRSRPLLLQAALGSVAFSGLAALFQQVVVLYAGADMGLDVRKSGFLFLYVAGGIAAGARLAGLYGRRATDPGCVPAGALLLAVGLLVLPFVASAWVCNALLCLVGVGGGLCLVPLNTYLQTAPPPDRRGEVLGASETASFAAIILSAGLVAMAGGRAGLSPRALLLATALLAVLCVVWAFRVLPDAALRFAVARLVNAVYRIDVEGLDNLPLTGGALIAINHTAYSDPPIIQSLLPRRMHFVMSRAIFADWKLFRPIFRLSGAILIHKDDGPRALVKAFSGIRSFLREGEAVAIFPEGELSRNGAIAPFKAGMERMLRGVDAPIIPVYIGNLWGSVFSYASGKPGLRLPRHPFSRRRVPVRIGKPLPPGSSASDVRAAVVALSQ